MGESDPVAVRMPAWLRDALERVAGQELTTLSAVIRRACKNELVRMGILPEDFQASE